MGLSLGARGLGRLVESQSSLSEPRPLCDKFQPKPEAPSPEPIYCTTIVPLIPGWIVHLYGYDPVAVNVKENVCDAGMFSALQNPVSDIDECASESAFVHVTVVPTVVFSVVGENTPE